MCIRIREPVNGNSMKNRLLIHKFVLFFNKCVIMSTVPTRQVQLGERTVDFPSDYLQILEDSNHLLNDKEGLLKELADKG